MALFKDKKTTKKQAVMASAPTEEETPGEIKHIEELSSDESITTSESSKEVQKNAVEDISNIQQVPVCMSQTQINNMIIENNMLLKYVISKID